MQGSETARDVFLNEGAKTIGVWLPLALADLKIAILAPWVDKDKRKELSVSKTLASWCLPMLSKAFQAAEEEWEAKSLFETIDNLRKRQEAKRNNADKI